MLHIRCSSLPLVMRCHAAAQKPSLVVHETCDAANTGTSTHSNMRRLVETESVDWDSIRTAEERALVAVGRRLWIEHLRELFPQAQCELTLQAQIGRVLLTGHTDVQSGTIGTARVLDWKTGRLDSDYVEQIRGYMGLVLLTNHAIDRVESHVAWLRDATLENYSMDRSALPEWCERVDAVADFAGVYEAGEHCGHCPRAHECPGHNAIVRRDASAILDVDLEELEEQLALMPAQRVLELVRRAKLVGNVAQRVRDAARAHVERTGDVHGDGARLTIETQNVRVVDSFAAWPVLTSVLDDRELATCVTVKLSAVESIVAKKAGHGRGAAAKRELKAKLNEVDSVRTHEVRKLVERRS